MFNLEGARRKPPRSQVEAQRSGFDLERRSGGEREVSWTHGSERYEARDDEGP